MLPSAFSAVTVKVPTTPAVVDEGKPLTVKLLACVDVPLREYGPAILGSTSATLLIVLDSVKVSRSARGGAAGAMLRPPPTPTPSRPGSPKPPLPPSAVLPESVLWESCTVPAATRIPPPAAAPPLTPYVKPTTTAPPA